MFIAPGVFFYLGIGSTADAHAHHAVQLVWAVSGSSTVGASIEGTFWRGVIPCSTPSAPASVEADHRG